ncbi:MAG: hypothetical protein ABEJ48_09885 [Halobacteriales archaeon]
MDISDQLIAHVSAADDDGDVHYECRECGTNLDAEHDTCPNCDGDIAA